MTVDKERLRELCGRAAVGAPSVRDEDAFLAAASPDVVLALLDENAALRRLALEACDALDGGGADSDRHGEADRIREEVSRG